MLLTQMLHEVDTGDWSVDGARQRREGGGYAMPRIVYIDAMSVYAACAASYIKNPSSQRQVTPGAVSLGPVGHYSTSTNCGAGAADALADGATPR